MEEFLVFTSSLLEYDVTNDAMTLRTIWVRILNLKIKVYIHETKLLFFAKI